MAFDGAYLQKIKQEIDHLLGGRIDKISQPSRESIVIAIRSGGTNHKIIISAEATGAKLHITKNQLENPKTAPMFCMLLRKHLSGGRLVRTEQAGLDRVLTLVFEAVNELGDRVEVRLVCEIMGRRSNIILVNAEGKIIDAIKRVDFVTSEVRQILSGITYALPPSTHKLNPLTTDPEQLSQAIVTGRDLPLSKAILEKVEGFSPMLCREISYFVCQNIDSPVMELTLEQKERLRFFLGVVHTALLPEGGKPYLVNNPEGKPIEFCFIPPKQYPENYVVEQYDSYSAILDTVYGGSDMAESLRQKSADLHKLLVTVRDRISRKLAAQREEQKHSLDREEKKQWGDIISANIYQMNKGDNILHAVNFFDEEYKEIDIPLDIMLTPAKNAQKYYSEYRKAATAETKLRELIESGEHELEYLETVISELERAETDAEILAIRDEVVEQGYARYKPRTGMKPEKVLPKQYLSSDGFTILSGRNNMQNDRLTLKEAANYDLWLHTQKIPGSHTIILNEANQEIPNRTIEEAAIITAVNSSASNSAKIPVDYTYIKHVKKPRGAKPGMVIYDNFKTAIVDPDKDLEVRLRKK